MSLFQEMNLPPSLEKALAEMKFVQPTPIQEKSIPHALARRDLIACAQTGTGKTAAFSIPLIIRLLRAPNRTALILAPTRELAAQIETVLVDLLKFTPELRTALLIGGVSMQPQIRALEKRPRIIIATPGRLLDHLNSGEISLSSVEYFVLDEADRMLDMGFAPQLNHILRHLPKTRQTLLFSATLAPEIQKLAMKILKDPISITVGEISKPADRIEQSVIETSVASKNETLLDQINARQGSMLIFARTQSRTDRLARYLTEYGLPVNRIHGGRSQGQRNSALQGFRDGKVRILVATDIAARGIDISHVAHVINYDLPQVPEDFIHRIGRTARAGASGEALSFVTPEDRSQWHAISRLLTKKGGTAPTPVRATPTEKTASQPLAQKVARPRSLPKNAIPKNATAKQQDRRPNPRKEISRGPRPAVNAQLSRGGSRPQ